MSQTFTVGSFVLSMPSLHVSLSPLTLALSSTEKAEPPWSASSIQFSKVSTAEYQILQEAPTAI